MNTVLSEWLQEIEDQEYFLQLWNLKLIEVDGLFFIEAHYNPKSVEQWLQEGKRFPLEKLENTVNHVHLDYFTENPESQRKLGQMLQRRWKQLLKQTFPNKKFEVNLVSPDENEWELELWVRRE